jgi:hypothetical protein
MTPLINGRRRLTATDEHAAASRVRVEREESNIASVTETGACPSDEGFAGGVPVWSGYDRDGKEDSIEEGMSSHFCDNGLKEHIMSEV